MTKKILFYLAVKLMKSALITHICNLSRRNCSHNEKWELAMIEVLTQMEAEQRMAFRKPF